MLQQNTDVSSKINILQEQMSKLPQAPAMETEHFYANGMYCRKIKIPKGNVIVSKTHKSEHLFIGCLGKLLVTGEGERYMLTSGMVKTSPVGTKRAVVAMTNVICMTIHKTNKTSPDELELELMEESGQNLYDSNNNPKFGVLVSDLINELENN